MAEVKNGLIHFLVGEEYVPIHPQTSQAMVDGLEDVLAGINSKLDDMGSNEAITELKNRVTTVEEGKVDKVVGKGLSEADYTNVEKIDLEALTKAFDLTDKANPKINFNAVSNITSKAPLIVVVEDFDPANPGTPPAGLGRDTWLSGDRVYTYKDGSGKSYIFVKNSEADAGEWVVFTDSSWENVTIDWEAIKVTAMVDIQAAIDASISTFETTKLDPVKTESAATKAKVDQLDIDALKTIVNTDDTKTSFDLSKFLVKADLSDLETATATATADIGVLKTDVAGLKAIEEARVSATAPTGENKPKLWVQVIN